MPKCLFVHTPHFCFSPHLTKAEIKMFFIFLFTYYMLSCHSIWHSWDNHCSFNCCKMCHRKTNNLSFSVTTTPGVIFSLRFVVVYQFTLRLILEDKFLRSCQCFQALGDVNCFLNYSMSWFILIANWWRFMQSFNFKPKKENWEPHNMWVSGPQIISFIPTSFWQISFLESMVVECWIPISIFYRQFETQTWQPRFN